MGVGDDVLGPRVTGEPYPEPPPISAGISQREARLAARPKPKTLPNTAPDTAKVAYDPATRMVSGFKVFLVKECKTIFLPTQEVQKNVAGADRVLLDIHPERFCNGFRNSLIIMARKELRERELGSIAEVDENPGESWMTPDQIAVLKELRAEGV